MHSKVHSFRVSEGTSGLRTKLVVAFTSTSRLTLPVTAYLFSRLTHATLLRSLPALGWQTRTVITRRLRILNVASRARPWINEMESRKWRKLRATRDRQSYSWSRIITNSETRFVKTGWLVVPDYVIRILESASGLLRKSLIKRQRNLEKQKSVKIHY